MASLAEAVAEAKDGLADLLSTTAGLRPADGVTVVSAPVEPLPSTDMVILGDVTVVRGQPELRGRDATPTMNGWVVISRPEGAEDAIRDARATASRYMGLIEAAGRAINKEPVAAGVPALAGSIQVAASGLQEAPADWQGQAVRQATVPFSLSWTSHIS